MQREAFEKKSLASVVYSQFSEMPSIILMMIPSKKRIERGLLTFSILRKICGGLFFGDRMRTRDRESTGEKYGEMRKKKC